MRSRLFALVVMLGLAGSLLAQEQQEKKESESEGETTAHVTFSGNSNSLGQIYTIDVNGGYETQHFSVEAGYPVLFVNPSFDNTGLKNSNNGAGDPYINLGARTNIRSLKYSGVVSLMLPLGNDLAGFSTGRLLTTWNNRFERNLGRVTPFVAAGIGNTIPDMKYYTRPFTSLGFDTHLEGGAELTVCKHARAGVLGFGDLPSGDQKIYSRLAKHAEDEPWTSEPAPDSRVFQTNFKTIVPGDAARDYGLTTYVSVNPSQLVEMGIGYTRSQAFDLNTLAFTTSFNLGHLMNHRP